MSACPHCGADSPEGKAFCADCGLKLSQAQGAERGHGRLRRLLVTGIAAVALAFLGVFFLHSHVEKSTENGPDIGNRSSSPRAAIRTPSHGAGLPEVEDVVVNAYDLVKNPFADKGKRVILDVRSYPMLLDGNFIRYQEPPASDAARALGLFGLKFNRMLSETTALYDARGYMLGRGFQSGSSMEDIGQLMVLFATTPAQLPSIENEGYWVVECLGVRKGTNYMGATISVPAVRFLEARASKAQLEAKAMARAEEARAREAELNQKPRILQNAEPTYPSDGSMEAGIEGTVVLSVTVGTDGKAHDIHLIESKGWIFESVSHWFYAHPDEAFNTPIKYRETQLGNPMIEEAIRCAEQWTFVPGTKDGKPADMSVKLIIEFRLPPAMRR
jgi:hypothetical protein